MVICIKVIKCGYSFLTFSKVTSFRWISRMFDKFVLVVVYFIWLWHWSWHDMWCMFCHSLVLFVYNLNYVWSYLTLDSRFGWDVICGYGKGCNVIAIWYKCVCRHVLPKSWVGMEFFCKFRTIIPILCLTWQWIKVYTGESIVYLSGLRIVYFCWKSLISTPLSSTCWYRS